MERKIAKSKNCLVGYHTQECWLSGLLTEPKPCCHTNAWLGYGYYFWTDLEFAHYWGLDSKIKTSPTGKYDIYVAHIEEEDLLDSVFDEAHYEFFVKTIESAIEKLKGLGVNERILHEKVNRYLVDKVWRQADVKGIVYQDIPANSIGAGRKYSEIPPLFYLKRIQIIVFDNKIIHNFEALLEELP